MDFIPSVVHGSESPDVDTPGPGDQKPLVAASHAGNHVKRFEFCSSCHDTVQFSAHDCRFINAAHRRRCIILAMASRGFPAKKKRLKK